MIAGLAHDFRAAGRSLARTPGLALGAAVCMAIGLGAAAAIFSFINATLLRPLPFPDAERIVDVEAVKTLKVVLGEPEFGSAYDPHYLHWQDEATQFEAFALYCWWPAQLSLDDARYNTKGLDVTAGFFDVLGVQPALGTFFEPGKDSQQEAGQVAVLGYEFWQRMFGGDEAIIGQSVVLNKKPFTVIGVAPPGMRYLPSRVGGNLGGLTYDDIIDFYVPLYRTLDPDPAGRGHTEWDCIARMKPGVAIEEAERELETLFWPLADGLIARAARAVTEQGTGRDVLLAGEQTKELMASLGPVKVRTLRAVVMADTVELVTPAGLGVGLLLLIACVNVACLLLVRGVSGQREAAIRAALGANRWRLMRLLIAQGVLISLFGGLLGLLLAFGIVHLLLPMAPGDIPGIRDVEVDWAVLGFGFGAAILVGVLVALVPAWRASTPRVAAVLNEESAGGGTGGHQRRLLGALVTAEVALTFTLLVAGGLLLNSYVRLANTDLGFNPNNVLTMRIVSEGRPHSYTEMVEKVRRIPGVEHAGMSYGAPFLGEVMHSIVGSAKEPVTLSMRTAGPGFFNALEVPLIAGRFFGPEDLNLLRDARWPLVINQSHAQLLAKWLGKRHVNELIGFEEKDGSGRVIGIVADFRSDAPSAAAGEQAYLPYTAPLLNHPQRLVIRTEGDPLAVAQAARDAILSVDRLAIVEEVQTLEAVLAKVTADRRFALAALAGFAVAGLVLAAVGLYGVMAYSALRRTRELGIRMACGAAPRDVFALIGRQGLTLVGAGIGVGAAGAYLATRFVQSALYGVSALDPATYAAVLVLVLAAGALAALIPAWRVSKAHPLEALQG